MESSRFFQALKEDSPYLIAETAYIYEGDLKYLNELIDKLCETNCCDAVKYHILLDIDAYAVPSHEVYDLIKKFLFSEEQWVEILKKTKSKGKEVIILVDEINAIEFVKKNIDLVDAVELHAIALNNIEMLEKIKSLPIPIILGVGGSEIEEIEFAIKYLDRKDILLMHGFQNYPTNYEFINFKRMKRLKEKFNFPVGYADHCSWDNEHNELITLAGFIAGANIIEKHVALKLGEKRIDFNSAITPEMLFKIKEKMNLLSKTKGEGSFSLNEYESVYGKNGPMKFTIVANRELKTGEILTKADITFRRTKEENEIKQKDFFELIGKKVSKDIQKFELINWRNVER